MRVFISFAPYRLKVCNIRVALSQRAPCRPELAAAGIVAAYQSPRRPISGSPYGSLIPSRSSTTPSARWRSWASASQCLVDYQPDFYFTPAIIGDGKILEILDYKQYAWPGHGVAKESGYQYVEGEYMHDEDYGALIDDPSDFWLRADLPRVCGALAPLR